MNQCNTKHLYGCLLILILLLLTACNSRVTIQIEREPASTPLPLTRPRYTLSYPKSAFLFRNAEQLPFQLLREMCWNSREGFCDPQFQGTKTPFLIWRFTDWATEREGEIYQIGKECYWQMYQSRYGADSQPHVQEHYWISCPEEIK